MTTTLQRNPRGFFYNLFVVIVSILVVIAAVYFFRTQFVEQEPTIPSVVTVLDPAPAPAMFDANYLLMDERFDVDNGSWELSPVGQAEYDGGGLILNDDQFDGEAWARPHLEFDNFVLDIHSRWLGGAIGGSYGIRFRYDDATGDYYSFHLENAGRYVIGKELNGDWFEIKSDFSSAIQNNGGINLIRIEAIGDDFRFFVNETYLADVANDGVATGDIILFATKADGTEQYLAAFDNLRIARHFGPQQAKARNALLS